MKKIFFLLLLSLVFILPKPNQAAVVVSTDVISLEAYEEFNRTSASDYAGVGYGAGDLNGDGFAELLVGASNDDSNGTDSGSVFVYYGQADKITSDSLSDTVLSSSNIKNYRSKR